MTDFSSYLIVSDLDGTLLDADGHIVPRNREAIERFCAGGGLFTLATGRVCQTLTHALGEVQKLVNAPVILANGAYLWDCQTDTYFQETFLDSDCAKELLAVAHEFEPNVQYRISAGAGSFRVRALIGRVLEDALKYYSGATIHASMDEDWPLDDWYKIVFRGDPQDLARVHKALLARFGERLTFVYSDPEILEALPTTVSKGTGLQKLLSTLKEPKRRTVIACGDYDNDLPMFRVANIAIAPANAQEIVKAAANAVLCHHEEGLIADVIARLGNGTLVPPEAKP